MSKYQCNLHFGGNVTSGNNQCNKCIPFITFKISLILLAGGLIGLAGLILVEDTPAATLLRHTASQTTQIQIIDEQLTQLNSTINQIKIDVGKLKQHIRVE